jgi:short-subunit dehydrogenase
MILMDFKDKVAVVTGAASGIGYGLSEKCAKEGMKLVLADIEEKALANAYSNLESIGAEILKVKTDVSKREEVEALAEVTYDNFGEVNLLINNAGVGVGGPLWEFTIVDWEWVLGVNLWGVIHGIKAFVPKMLKQDSYGHIINTASTAGFASGPYNGPYYVSKHGVVVMSEVLHHELKLIRSKIRVSVLCPGFIKTNIIECERNRPPDLTDVTEKVVNRDVQRYLEYMRSSVDSGMSTESLADIVFDSIRNEKFYIFPNPEWKERFKIRFEEILEEHTPTTTWKSAENN